MNQSSTLRQISLDEFHCLDFLEPFELGYRNSWSDKFRPTKQELKEMIHIRFLALSLREFGTRLEGKWLVINPDCGEETEDGARSNPACVGSGNYDRNFQRTPLPEGFWTWGEIVLAIIEATGITQSVIAQRIGVSEYAISSYIHKGISPREGVRIKLIKLADECSVLQEETDYAEIG